MKGKKMETKIQCPTCKGKLRVDEVRGCLTCDLCHPQGKVKQEFNEGAPAKVVELDENRVREIVREEMAEIGKPLLSLDTETGKVEILAKPQGNDGDWRGKAKKLNIELYDKANNRPRLKVDVLKEIEEKSNVDDSD